MWVYDNNVELASTHGCFVCFSMILCDMVVWKIMCDMVVFQCVTVLFDHSFCLERNV